MKSFDEYQDGEWVVYVNAGHVWDTMFFQAYKSQYTKDAFRLKYGNREVIADILEIRPIKDSNDVIQERFKKFQDGNSPGLPELKVNQDAESDFHLLPND